MQQKIKKQNGFIQIPLLIAIIVSVIVAAGLGTAIVLHKQDKMPFSVAQVSEALKKDEFAVLKNQETQIRDSYTEDTTPLGETFLVDNGSSDVISQQELQKIELEIERERIKSEAEQARAEAERAKAEAEKARVEAEKLKKEAEEAKKKAEEEALKTAQEQAKVKAEEEARQQQERVQQAEEETRRQEQERQDLLESERAKEQERLENIRQIDEELSKLIAELKERAEIFSAAKKEADGFVSTVRNTMNKYPNSNLIQQSGQELINEVNKMSFTAEKLFNIENQRISLLSSFMGSGKLPVNDNLLIAEYNSFRNQYDLTNANINSLMEIFVNNEKTVLEEELGRKNKVNQILDELLVLTQTIDVQIAVLVGQIEDKEAEIEREENRLAPMSIIEARLAQLIPELNYLIGQYNILINERKQIVNLSYNLDDYADYGTPLSAEDRTLLWSLGIDF